MRHLYSVLQSCGGSLLNHPQCAASTFTFMDLADSFIQSAFTVHSGYTFYIIFFISILRWCDGCHRTTGPVRSPHTSYRWRGERVIEPIKCMRSPHTRYRWRGESVIEPIKCMRSPHTRYRWRGESVIEPIKCMRSPHTSYRWRGERVIEPANQVDGDY